MVNLFQRGNGMNAFRFPAVLIGGPPHSGKSVFTYLLKRALQRLSPPPAFYVLRAAPDGEGDWFHEADPRLVRRLRYKRPFDKAFAERIAQAVTGRHLPLLVDAGGKITEEQRIIARRCTHALLLSADPSRLREWEEFAREMGLTVLAALHSRLDGQGDVEVPADPHVPIRGTLTQLRRHTHLADQPALGAVVRRLQALFAFDHMTLRAVHRRMLPAGAHLVDVYLWPAGRRWEPHMLAQFVASLPDGPLALYGVAPTWVYGAAAAATAARSAQMFQFDSVLGWITPPELAVGAEPLGHFHCVCGPEYTVMNVRLPQAYVEREALAGAGAPEPRRGHGLVVGGKLPLWLYTALVRLYAPRVPWLAIYAPQNKEAVVVSARQGAPVSVGDVCSLNDWPFFPSGSSSATGSR